VAPVRPEPPASGRLRAWEGGLAVTRRAERREAQLRRERVRQVRRRRRRLAVAGLVVVALAAAGAVARETVLRPALAVAGPPDGAVLGAGDLRRVAFVVDAPDARFVFDGNAVEPVRAGDRVVFRPRGLADGEHAIEVTAGGSLAEAPARYRSSFTVDTTPPRLRLAQPAVAASGAPLAVRGTVEPGARLAAGGRAVPVRDGEFRLWYAVAPALPVTIVATDAAGNRSRWRMPVTLVPRRPAAPVRGVHMTAVAWANDPLREGVFDLIRAGRIDAVELDLKDESGTIGWRAPVALGRRMGAVDAIYDLPAAVRRLHDLGVRVIGRLVCFRDPVHAAAAWRDGRRDEVVQTPAGAPYAGYGGFTNFANEAVRRYNIAIAVAAARAGVDEVLYDYVRRPDGPPSSMTFPGLRGAPERSIARFLAETRRALRPHGTLLGASVFGIAATRPHDVAQDVPAMARHVDYISPMVYPSHWSRDVYDVPDPNGQPRAIVERSLRDFRRLVRGTGARLVPWLQDFSLGRAYGPAEVRAQIEGARAAGIDEWLLWDPAVTYTAAALATDAPDDALGMAPFRAPKDAPGLRRIG
jgi:hypothetical protein